MLRRDSVLSDPVGDVIRQI